MRISSTCEFTFTDSDVKGAWIEFSFDKFFTVDMLNSYDKDKNNIFDNDETKMIYDHAFINLKNYGFFISIRDNRGRYSPENVDGFSVYIKDEMITYRFYINIVSSEERELYLSVYDPTFFCACYYDETLPVSINSLSNIQTTFSIVENTDFPVYYDPYASASNNVTYEKWEPGLQTFYPKEIHLAY